jgi:hypothetical protein
MSMHTRVTDLGDRTARNLRRGRCILEFSNRRQRLNVSLHTHTKDKNNCLMIQIPSCVPSLSSPALYPCPLLCLHLLRASRTSIAVVNQLSAGRESCAHTNTQAHREHARVYSFQ